MFYCSVHDELTPIDDCKICYILCFLRQILFVEPGMKDRQSLLFEM